LRVGHRNSKGEKCSFRIRWAPEGLDAIRKLPTRVGFQGDISAVDVGQIMALSLLDLGVFR
jgi:hypothetical protein